MQPHLIGGGWELRFQTPHGLFKYIYIYIYILNVTPLKLSNHEWLVDWLVVVV